MLLLPDGLIQQGDGCGRHTIDRRRTIDTNASAAPVRGKDAATHTRARAHTHTHTHTHDTVAHTLHSDASAASARKLGANWR